MSNRDSSQTLAGHLGDLTSKIVDELSDDPEPEDLTGFKRVFQPVMHIALDQGVVWFDIRGRRHFISEMEDSHLINVIRFLRAPDRTASLRTKWHLWNFGEAPLPQDEQANLFWIESTALMIAMRAECERRGIEPHPK